MLTMNFDHKHPELFQALGISKELNLEVMDTFNGTMLNFPKVSFSEQIEKTLQIIRTDDTKVAALFIIIGGMIENARISAMQESSNTVAKS